MDSTTDTTSSESEIETLVSFKVQNRPMCIICNDNKGEIIRATERTFSTFVMANKILCNIDIINETIQKVISDAKSRNKFDEIFWHKLCYISYTNKRNIEAKRKSNSRLKEYKLSGTEPLAPVGKSLRTGSFDIKKCVFCQKRLGAKRLSQVMSKNIEHKIKTIAESSSKILQRIGSDDLIAAEVKYHPDCLVVEKRKLLKSRKSNMQNTNTTASSGSYKETNINTILTFIKNGLQKGKSYSTTAIYSKYTELGGNKSKTTLTRLIKKHFEKSINFVTPKSGNVSTIIMPPIEKSELIQNYMETCTSSNSSDVNLSLGTSELSQVVKICADIASDLDKIPNHTDLQDLSVQNYTPHIPQALLWLISLLLSEENCTNDNVVNICQDIIYSRSKGKKLTPKHIGIGIFVHQETRSKKLINTLHASGHSISYEDVLRLRNSIAQQEISRYLANNNCFIPKQLVPDRFVQFAADNIDILEETLDKSPTFHGTQILAFQKGPKDTNASKNVELLPYRAKLNIPDTFHELQKLPCYPNKVTPQIKNKSSIVEKNEEKNFIFSYNLSWVLCRTTNLNTDELIIPQWSGFSKLVHKDEQVTTTYGYLPLLPYVASEYDTVWSTMLRCDQIAKSLNMTNTVLTFDQAIYYKSKQIQWLKLEECKHFVIRLGGFHILLNFLKVIGQHMNNSGLRDVWLEAGLYGESTVQGILQGKKYNKSIRAHKLTYESLMRILIPIFEKWLNDCKSDDIHTLNHSRLMATEVSKAIKEKKPLNIFFNMVTVNQHFRGIFNEFIETQSVNVKYWFSYLELVNILLEFLYAERTGNWLLHLESFQKMLPWFFVYDHTNYSRWGCIYLSDMKNLEDIAPAVYKEYMEGQFVVKRLSGDFNRISVDQAVEHVNKMSKDAGGIVGLTKNSTRLDEWYLSFNEIGVMTDTFLSSLLTNESRSQNIEIGKKRMALDEEWVITLVEQLNKFEVFKYGSTKLTSISTKEIFSAAAETLKLTAKEKGQTALKSFSSIVDTPDFYKPLKKMQKTETINKKVKSSPTSQSLHGQQLLQKILSAKDMGRSINYAEIFKFELTAFPMSLTLNGYLGTPTNKSSLGNILEQYGLTYKDLPKPIDSTKTCHIFDGMAIVQGLGKPKNCTSFKEYANLFATIIFKNKFNAQRVDVVFDHYRENSIKNTTRQKRGSQKSIDIEIDRPNIPLPQQWNLFIHSVFNKRRLTNFLSEQLLENSITKKHIQFATSGGFANINEYGTNFEPSIDDYLNANHEEADTRILLHILSAKNTGYSRCIIDCNDTDVLVLLIYFKKFLTKEIWFRMGRGDSRRFLAVHDLNLDENLLKNLPAFHSLTGCDTTSQLSGIGKKTCWKTYLQYHHLLDGFGTDQYSENIFLNIEKFFIKIYSKTANVTSINILRGLMASSKTIAKLPPTEDALRLHCLRCFYQLHIWLSSLKPQMQLPNVEEYGWKVDEGGSLIPVLKTLPDLPPDITELTSCKCKKDCGSKVCKCRKNKIGCIGSCTCMAQKNCKNSLTAAANVVENVDACGESDSD